MLRKSVNLYGIGQLILCQRHHQVSHRQKFALLNLDFPCFSKSSSRLTWLNRLILDLPCFCPHVSHPPRCRPGTLTFEGSAAARGGQLRCADDQRRAERGASGGEDAEGARPFLVRGGCTNFRFSFRENPL